MQRAHRRQAGEQHSWLVAFVREMRSPGHRHRAQASRTQATPRNDHFRNGCKRTARSGRTMDRRRGSVCLTETSSRAGTRGDASTFSCLRHVSRGGGGRNGGVWHDAKQPGCLSPKHVLRERKGEGGSGTQKFVYQKWPESIFPSVNLFSLFPTMKSGSRGEEGPGLYLQQCLTPSCLTKQCGQRGSLCKPQACVCACMCVGVDTIL